MTDPRPLKSERVILSVYPSGVKPEASEEGLKGSGRAERGTGTAASTGGWNEPSKNGVVGRSKRHRPEFLGILSLTLQISPKSSG